MKVLLTFTYDVSLKDWDKSGIIHREIALYKKLLDKGIEFKFLTYGNHEDLKYNHLLNDIKVFPVFNHINSKNFLIKLLKYFILPLKLRSIFKDVDVIKTNQVKGCWIGIFGKILYRKKIIIRGGYEWFRDFLGGIKTREKGIKNNFKYLINYIYIYMTEFIAYKLADGIVLTSNSNIRYIIKKFGLQKDINKIFHIYNFIDVNSFKPKNVEKKDKHVLYIGRIHFRKNLKNLLKAFINLKEFTLDIVGTGVDKEFLRTEAKRLNLNVNFFGVIPNDKLPDIINQYQIFILPSFFEGNPKVLLEAMSCGIACIGSNVRGINNIIKHEENGYLCGTDSESIREAILTVYNEKKLRKRIGKTARDFIINNCSIDLIVKKEFKLYKEVLSK